MRIEDLPELARCPHCGSRVDGDWGPLVETFPNYHAYQTFGISCLEDGGKACDFILHIDCPEMFLDKVHGNAVAHEMHKAWNAIAALWNET